MRRIDPSGTITTIAGTGAAGFAGDGGLATTAQPRWPEDLAFGPDGSLYVAEDEGHRVRRIDPSGIITTVAGTGAGSYGGPATAAQLRNPRGIAVARDGSLIIADADNQRLRRVR